MITNFLESLAESPHRRLIVIIVTFGTSLATVLPQVDLYLASRTERTELEEQIARASETVEQLPDREARAAEKSAEMKRMHDRQVDESRVTGLRSWLVDTARGSGCQVRRINIQPTKERRWAHDDDATGQAPPLTTASLTSFDLQTHRVVLSVTGTSDEVRELLKAIDADQRLKHVQSIRLKPESRRRKLELELILQYFALVRHEQAA